jgi:hypothetical protein
MTYGNKSSMFGRTLILEPLAQAADGNAGSLPDAGFWVLETSLDDGPNLIHEGGHELAASLNADTKGKNSTAAASRIGRAEVLNNESAESGEDLRRWQVGGQSIDDAESRLWKDKGKATKNEENDIRERELHRQDLQVPPQL